MIRLLAHLGTIICGYVITILVVFNWIIFSLQDLFFELKKAIGMDYKEVVDEIETAIRIFLEFKRRKHNEFSKQI